MKKRDKNSGLWWNIVVMAHEARVKNEAYVNKADLRTFLLYSSSANCSHVWRYFSHERKFK